MRLLEATRCRLSAFRSRFRVVARSRLTSCVVGLCTIGTGSEVCAGINHSRHVFDHIRRSVRYVDPPPHTAAVPRGTGPEN